MLTSLTINMKKLTLKSRRRRCDEIGSARCSLAPRAFSSHDRPLGRYAPSYRCEREIGRDFQLHGFGCERGRDFRESDNRFRTWVRYFFVKCMVTTQGLFSASLLLLLFLLLFLSCSYSRPGLLTGVHS